MRRWKIAREEQVIPILDAVELAVRDALKGGAVEVSIVRPSRTRDQEAKYHAMIGDIARTVKIDGKAFDRDTWKAVLIHEFGEEMRESGTPLRKPGRIVPGLRPGTLVAIRPSSKDFDVEEASQFIEFLYQKGTELGAKFSDPVIRYYESLQNR